MVLIAGLFAVDMFYKAPLSGAVERALDLERMTNPWIRLTRYVNSKAMRTGAEWAKPVLYGLLMATSVILRTLKGDIRLRALAGGVGLVLAAMGLCYWVGVRTGAKLHTEKPRYWPEDGLSIGDGYSV